MGLTPSRKARAIVLRGSSMQILRVSCIVFLLALLSASLGFSQAVNATLVGTITDVGGGVVPNAKVTITETNTGIVHVIQTNESGNFTLARSPAGTIHGKCRANRL